MAPISQLSLLALASAVLAVPHAEPLRRHAHVHQRGAPPAYGESSAPPAYGSSSEASPVSSSAAPPAYGSSSAAPPAYGSSSEAAPVSSSAIPAYGSSSLPAYGSGSSAGPASSSGLPSYSYSFSGVPSSGYAMPTGSYAHPTGSYGWGSTGYAHPTGSYSGPVSYSTCTETSTLIYRSTTEYSTYHVTHTIYPGGSSTGAIGGSASGYPSEAPSSPASGSAPAGYPSGAPSGAPVSPASSGIAEGSCIPDVTVTTTERSTIYVTVGPSSAAPSAPAATPTNTWKASWEPAPSPSGAPAPSSYPTPSEAPAPSSAAPAPSSYAPAPSTPASPGNSGYGGKRGLAYNDAALTNMFAKSANVGWAYNWESDNKGLDSGVPYIPTLWGTDSMWTSIWETNAKSAISGGAKYLFSFNEPDMPTQANLSPEAAAAAWKTYMEPFAGQVKLVAPGVTNGQSPGLGLDWLQSFLSACSDCTIDAVAQHWYWDSNDSGAFKEQLQKTIDTVGKPLWVNEFGAVGSDAEKGTFLQDVMSWMDGNDSIL